MFVKISPFNDQRPGTAGLRKKVSVFQQPHYLESFAEAIFRCCPQLDGGTVVIGGDGRYHNRPAIQTLVRMASAHGVKKVVIGQQGHLSTPAASHLIRETGAAGGFLLTASHNPAGPDGDFGIKFNTETGGQASEQLTEDIYRCTQSLDGYHVAEPFDVDLDTPGASEHEGMQIEIVDPVHSYAALMQQLFDFDAIRNLLASGFSLCFDAMHAVTGPYARCILGELLGATETSLLNCQPQEDFGGGHPDPNLVYARQLVDIMMGQDAPDFGAASDGDGDRNMILGKRIFVSPGDSLAVLAANAHRFPGYAGGLPGVARSMPTSRAVDAVAEALDIPCYETPTGWRFFCNLLEDGRIGLCGEESFGTSSHHAREKDGLWAALAWLNLLALEGKSVAGVMQAHWQRFGRHYYQRQDFENLDMAQADQLITGLRDRLPSLQGQTLNGLYISQADEFAYHDPVDGSVSKHQGLRIVMGEAARIVVRLSGTGTAGATLRLYLERYERQAIDMQPEAALSDLAAAALELLDLPALTGRNAPDLVT